MKSKLDKLNFVGTTKNTRYRVFVEEVEFTKKLSIAYSICANDFTDIIDQHVFELPDLQDHFFYVRLLFPNGQGEDVTFYARVTVAFESMGDDPLKLPDELILSTKFGRCLVKVDKLLPPGVAYTIVVQQEDYFDKMKEFVNLLESKKDTMLNVLVIEFNFTFGVYHPIPLLVSVTFDSVESTYTEGSNKQKRIQDFRNFIDYLSSSGQL